MDQKPTRKRKSRIQIPVLSKPRPYRPGDGPPLAPLGILLVDDSDAFIVDKRVLPDTTPNGELKLQMYYVVGWKDLPAARVTILATRVHDYVSPRVVEDFEYKALLERDEEIERQEAEKNRKAKVAAKKKAAKPTNATGASMRASTPITSVSRRRGRPSKAELQAQRLSQRASISNAKSIEVVLPPASTSGPSLSTPKRKRVKELVTDLEEEADDEDADGAIFKQLCGDNDDIAEAMDIDDNGNDDDILSDKIPKTMPSGLEIRSYAKTPWLKKDSTLFKRANGNLALKTPTSHVPISEMLRSNKQLSPPKQAAQSRPHPPRKQQNGHPHITPAPVPTPLRSAKDNSQPKPFNTKQSTTPVSVPSWPRPTIKRGPAASAASTPPQPPKGTLEHHGFTPAGRSSAKWPSAALPPPGDIAAEPPLVGQGNGIEHEESSHQREKQSNPKPESNKKKDKAWVVERLEGDRIVDVNGTQVRYFKVRWEGDWPPSQNPTWEPEENITPGLVKRYLRRKAARRKTISPTHTHHSHSPIQASSKFPLTLKRKYSSVAEAFAGDEYLDELRNDVGQDAGTHVDGVGLNADGDDGEDELLIVATEQETKSARHRSNPKVKTKPEASGAIFMRDLTAAIHRGPNHAREG